MLGAGASRYPVKCGTGLRCKPFLYLSITAWRFLQWIPRTKRSFAYLQSLRIGTVGIFIFSTSSCGPSSLSRPSSLRICCITAFFLLLICNLNRYYCISVQHLFSFLRVCASLLGFTPPLQGPRRHTYLDQGAQYSSQYDL